MIASMLQPERWTSLTFGAKFSWMFIIGRRKGENITSQIQKSGHLGHSVEMNEKGRGMKLARLTVGGISTTVASAIQITPFRKENISISQNNCNWRERNRPDLFPEEPGQTKRAITVMAHAEQANKHDDK